MLNGKGTVVFFTIAGQANLSERLNGYQAALAAFPGIKATQVIDMKGDPRVAFDSATALVEKKADVDAFVSLESLSGSEIAEVSATPEGDRQDRSWRWTPPPQRLNGSSKGAGRRYDHAEAFHHGLLRPARTRGDRSRQAGGIAGA